MWRLAPNQLQSKAQHRKLFLLFSPPVRITDGHRELKVYRPDTKPLILKRQSSRWELSGRRWEAAHLQRCWGGRIRRLEPSAYHITLHRPLGNIPFPSRDEELPRVTSGDRRDPGQKGRSWQGQVRVARGRLLTAMARRPRSSARTRLGGRSP